MSRVRKTTNNQKHRNEGEGPFVCIRCGRPVALSPTGTHHRNHCPHCLWSRHFDRNPGDRLSPCRGSMSPIGVWLKGGEWMILHRCERCTIIRANRIAGDDDLPSLLGLAARPLAHPPVPVEEAHP